MDLNALFQRRPFLYHLTARPNLDVIRRGRELRCAASILEGAGREGELRIRRHGAVELESKAGAIVLPDQDPLHPGNIDLATGFGFDDLLVALNSKVFFWPGDHLGPIPYGQRHFARYSHGGPAVLRIPFKDLLACNPETPPLLCRFNSGAPRCSGGKKSPRGPNTFVEVRNFSLPPSRVVEVTFDQRVALPASTQLCGNLAGPWISFFA